MVRIVAASSNDCQVQRLCSAANCYNRRVSTANDQARAAEPLARSERLWRTPVVDDLAFLLARANAVSVSRVNAALQAVDLRVRAYSVLAIAANNARPSQRELSEFLRLDPSQIVALIDELQSRGLVEREPDPNDRRANVVVATPAGRDLLARAQELAREVESEMFGALDGSEREALAQALRVMAGAVEVTPDR
ncbi:MAG TPA: MarR family transcriptional regulator [Microbacterium sp.]|nr:MarR family transcriptional regulator [Microbacterium sp.]